jgi:ATP-dependent RNA helicase RhlE
LSFSELGLHPTLSARLGKLGYTRAAPTHAQLLPPILDGADVLVSCASGAGCFETALFVLLHRCLHSPETDAAYVILTCSESHAEHTAKRTKALTGDELPISIISESTATTRPEKAAPFIAINTAEKFLAQLRESGTSAITPTALLFADTDEMIARGKRTTLLEIGELLTTKPQVLICTGRETRSVARVSQALQCEPVRHTIKPDDKHPEGIPQQVWPVPDHLKTSLLLKLQRRYNPATMLVIAAENHTASRVARQMRAGKTSAAALLNSDSQKQQNSLRARFEAAEIKLLLLSGGIPANLPVAEVTHVVNYNMPSKSKDYFKTLRRVPHAVHLNLVTPREEERVLEIEDGLGRLLLRDALPDFDYIQPDRERERASHPEKKAQRSVARAKPRAKKTEWHPDIPRSWGDRNAPRKDPEKIPLAEWSPEPLPAIWSEQKTSSSPTAPKPFGRGRPRRRRRGGSRNKKR